MDEREDTSEFFQQTETEEFPEFADELITFEHAAFRRGEEFLDDPFAEEEIFDESANFRPEGNEFVF